ncbi:hypothetical protein AMTR_s00011p00257200 [Amborella trichopoda]|uniref:Uncharacterized protein n=1 Tax=Amborella trichopoda TaxID=13333 RepID=W1NGZ2_AMBTC|nr:hypothetical protein AMTR_s00011p00257200 [Amborella trichopoda]
MSIRIPFMNTSIENLPQTLLMATCLGTPPILVTESSDSSENDLLPHSRNWSNKPYNRMEVWGKAIEMLKGLHKLHRSDRGCHRHQRDQLAPNAKEEERPTEQNSETCC